MPRPRTKPAPQREVKKHGTGGYAIGCKCDVCRGAAVDYVRRKRADAQALKPPKVEPEPLATVKRHGTTTGYAQGCRAKCCRDAAALQKKLWRARIKAQTEAPNSDTQAP